MTAPPRAPTTLMELLRARAWGRDALRTALDDLADWLVSPRRAAIPVLNPAADAAARLAAPLSAQPAAPDDHPGEAVRAVLARANALADAPGLRIAILGPTGAGKTELAWALGLADDTHRLLPGVVGSAPCVVEVGWERNRGASLWLLPIETRAEPTPIADLRRQPERWLRLALDPDDPAQVAATLGAVRQTKPIARALAARLGLRGTEPVPAAAGRPVPPVAAAPAAVDGALITVPCWRYALLSLPYPLLRAGLVVYDLPGPEALALEPDLAQALLDSADARCLVWPAGALAGTLAAVPAEARAASLPESAVAADAAAVWFWRRLLRNGAAPLLVALNCPEHAGALPVVPLAAPEPVPVPVPVPAPALPPPLVGLSAVGVVPFCARRALLGRIVGKPRLLVESGLPTLEAALAGALAAVAPGRMPPGRVDRDIVALLAAERRRVTAAIAVIDVERRALHAVIARAAAHLAALRARMQADEARQLDAVARFEAAHAAINAAADPARSHLAAPRIDDLLAAGRRDLDHAWHSLALAHAMRALFVQLRALFRHCEIDAARLRERIGQQATALADAVGVPVTPPPVFDLKAYRVELDLLHDEALAFARAPRVLLAGREALLARFESQLLLPAREVLLQLGADWDAWQAAAVAALAAPVQRQQARVAGHAAQMDRCAAICGDAERRLADLRQQQLALARDLTRLRDLGERIGADGPADRPNSFEFSVFSFS